MITRREILRIGLGGWTSLSLAGLAALRAQAAPESSQQRTAQQKTAVIIVWLPGGASHLETYDPKPLAGSEFAGPFQAIDTRMAGMRISELLPRHAKVADRFSLLRSLVHTGFCHQQGTQQLLTGHPVRELKNKPDHPDLLSIVHSVRHDPTRELPNYVGIPGINYGGAAYLGPSFEPFFVSGDVNAPQFEVPNVGLKDAAQVARMRSRLDLRVGLDQMQRSLDLAGNMRAYDAFETQAWNVLTSEATRRAFDLSLEQDATRERYGRNSWGQQCLLARRLVEAGVELVTTQFGGPLCGRVGNWDDHAVNHHCFEAMQYRTAFFDQAVAALIEDLYDRGLDQRVLLIVSGEFGRTPRINYQPSTGEGIGSGSTGTVQPGRDHWPSATSILFAGGGIRTGQVIGATDARGEQVVERRVGVGDFLATVYRHLGVDPTRLSIRDFSGRPVPVLGEGEPIRELDRVL